MIFEKEEAIPLMIKRYEDGEMTKKLFSNESQKELIISKPLGGGLKYDTLPS
jgi:NAD(P)H-flavin reductase